MVSYNPKIMVEIGKIMARCDLGITGVRQTQTEVFSWETTAKLNKAYFKKMEKAIKQFIESEGCEFIKVEYI